MALARQPYPEDHPPTNQALIQLDSPYLNFPQKEGYAMLMYQCPHCGKPLLRTPDPEHPLRSYTPTMNGFERFLCEAVGLQAGAPGEGPEVSGSDQEGRERR